MAHVHPTAIVSPEARIEADVTIGAFAVIGNVILGRGIRIHPHVVIADGVIIGAGTEIFPGSFIGKEPKGAGATARTIEFAATVEIGEQCSIGPHAIIYYDVKIGSQTLIGDGASIREQCRVGSRCIISRYVTINYNTVIGNGVKVMDLTHLTGNMIVEDDAFISAMVGTANDNLIRAGYGDHVVGPYIERGAVVGLGASLLPNSRIGRDATVGAGAVVTRSVPPNAVVLGIPAHITGYVNARGLGLEKGVMSDPVVVEEFAVRGVVVHKIPKIVDMRGSLTVGEFEDTVPFAVKRYFMVYDVPSLETRGAHAHRKCHQFLVCVRGSCAVVVDDGEARQELQLDRPEFGLHLSPMVWGIQYKFSPETILLVFASHHYDPGDYIRDYEEFLSIAGAAS